MEFSEKNSNTVTDAPDSLLLLLLLQASLGGVWSSCGPLGWLSMRWGLEEALTEQLLGGVNAARQEVEGGHVRVRGGGREGGGRPQRGNEGN